MDGSCMGGAGMDAWMGHGLMEHVWYRPWMGGCIMGDDIANDDCVCDGGGDMDIYVS